VVVCTTLTALEALAAAGAIHRLPCALCCHTIIE